MTLEQNQREMAVQHAEIVRLREQIQMLTGQHAADGQNGDTRPASQQERPILRSPYVNQPRAASAMD